MNTDSKIVQAQTMQRYYRLQSSIYDATRWSFLFGRRQLIRSLPFEPNQPLRILEVGCGTGFNLVHLAKRFPEAEIHGMDVSEDMLRLAAKSTAAYGNRIRLHARPYQQGDTEFAHSMDTVIFSYSLTMINPQWPELILQAKADLKPGGLIGVTDFHDSKRLWFKRHMSGHHVRMDGHLLPFLETHFEPIEKKVRPAYMGIWEYLLFIGKKNGHI